MSVNKPDKKTPLTVDDTTSVNETTPSTTDDTSVNEPDETIPPTKDDTTSVDESDETTPPTKDNIASINEPDNTTPPTKDDIKSVNEPDETTPSTRDDTTSVNESDKTPPTIDDFYNWTKQEMISADAKYHICFISSRSTEDNINAIDKICLQIKDLCKKCLIPTEGILLKETDLSIKAFKYLICNTKFTSQSLLFNDAVNTHIVNKQPAFSPYLFIEILWYLNFEDILSEAILHVPIDLCNEILEILPRAIDILNFERAHKFLKSFICNAYKKLIILKNIGSQSENIIGNSKKFATKLQEIVFQFANERLLKLEGVSESEKYKRYGILLKSIIQMVKICLTTKSQKIELSSEIENMYKLTFGTKPYEKIDDMLLGELFTEVDRELVSLLLKKFKEVDCNAYIDWTEHKDEEDASLTLQKAVRVECYFFIENTKEFKDSNLSEYNELIDSLQQMASKPDPKPPAVEELKVQLQNGEINQKKDSLLALFHRYKEWNDSTIDCIDNYSHLLSKDDCEKLFEQVVAELNQPQEDLDIEKLQKYILCYVKALIHLKMIDFYDITIKFILKFYENDIMNNIDISNFEKFIMGNTKFSAENLRVVLYFLCIKTRHTLEILLKIAIGHHDYADKTETISLDDLMLLLPILKIRFQSESVLCNSTIMEKTLSVESFDEEQGNNEIVRPKSFTTLAVILLRNICLEGGEWDYAAFSHLLEMLYPFCKVSEIINEIFIPFLMSDVCTLTHFCSTLEHLVNLIEKYDSDTSEDIATALDRRALIYLTDYSISRNQIDFIFTKIVQLKEYFINHSFFVPCGSVQHQLFLNTGHHDKCKCRLQTIIFRYMHCYQIRMDYNKTNYSKNLIENSIIRHIFLKCTRKQYMEYANEILTSYGKTLKWYGHGNICDNIIRLTFETILLCLVYPNITFRNSVSFLLNCLNEFLSIMYKSQKNSRKFCKKICESLANRASILKPCIEHTAISDAYKELIQKFKENSSYQINSKCDYYFSALERFHTECEQKNLSTYSGPYSNLAVKCWLAYNVVNSVFKGTEYCEDYILNPEECLFYD